MAVSSIGSRLKAIRKALKINQRGFCKGIYLSQSFYAQLESETGKINDRIIELIVNKYRVNKDYLKEGKGEMFNGETPDIDLIQLLDIYKELNPLFKKYITLQIKQLFEVQKGIGNAMDFTPKGKQH